MGYPGPRTSLCLKCEGDIHSFECVARQQFCELTPVTKQKKKPSTQQPIGSQLHVSIWEAIQDCHKICYTDQAMLKKEHSFTCKGFVNLSIPLEFA